MFRPARMRSAGRGQEHIAVFETHAAYLIAANAFLVDTLVDVRCENRPVERVNPGVTTVLRAASRWSRPSVKTHIMRLFS